MTKDVWPKLKGIIIRLNYNRKVGLGKKKEYIERAGKKFRKSEKKLRRTVLQRTSGREKKKDQGRENQPTATQNQDHQIGEIN